LRIWNNSTRLLEGELTSEEYFPHKVREKNKQNREKREELEAFKK